VCQSTRHIGNAFVVTAVIVLILLLMLPIGFASAAAGTCRVHNISGI
jgi:hypothetical protein